MRRASKRAHSSTTIGAPFDLKAVRTKADEDATTHRKHPRIFGLQEAPTFYPTKEEFKDPLSYIEKISIEGEKYGIIKIVPPKDYQPEFSLNTENFRFRTRLQKLNSMEGETRTNVNYLEQLTKYHILTGRPVGKIPQLDKRPIDLYKLKNEVSLRGGVQEVTRLKKWAEIGRVLGYARKQCTSMSNALKTAYQKVILPYEIWYAKHKDDVERVIKKEDRASLDSNDESDTCEICHKNENEEELLLCDGCNRGYHTYCLNPPLTSIPKTDWFCLQCLTAVGKDYGFEDGEEHSLGDFHKVCDKFKQDWFAKATGEIKTITEEECENEFWRLVENPHETCEVEYGADLHSTQHGSGFVAAEQMPKGRFDPWNLNVIPVDPQSLFTHIKSDISGMMVPWLYVGMCFSAFCWHNEDHYTYSINYMHWGETKTWYGVPGSDTAKFEDTMRKAVPELFEQQPDLLFQLVTMLSPGRLLKENVKVYAVDQRPGQFVVTYPKAYHSGFNHGFNFCEAVNFAPGKWVDYGLECVKRYKAFRRQPCFSHDELLVTASQNIKPTGNVEWLKRALVEMQTRELNERNAIRATGVIKEETTSDARNELQCVFCHCYTFLSHIGCPCTTKVGCLEHASELCTCDLSEKTMYLRFTDTQIDEIVKKVTQSAIDPTEWMKRVDKVTSSLTKGSATKPLKELLKEGHELNVPKECLDTLKDFIETVDSWTVETERLLYGKHDTQKPAGKRRWEKAKELVEQASEIGFDLFLLDELKSYFTRLSHFEARLNESLFCSGNIDLQTKLYQEGLQLRADSVKFYELKNLIESSSWEERAEKALYSPFNPKAFRKIIKDAEDIGMRNYPGSLLHRLVQMEEFGKEALQRAENICKGKEKINMNDEEAVLQLGQHPHDPSLSVTLDPQLIQRLKNSIAHSKQILQDLEDFLLNQCSKPTMSERPYLIDAQHIMTSCRELCFQSDLVTQLANEISRITAWNEQVRYTFMNGRQKALETVLRETMNNVERITSSENKQSFYCICRKSESGLMIECDSCREWYHGSCVKVPRNVMRSSHSYVCPVCHTSESTKKITHLSRQPKLEEIIELIQTAETFKFKPKDYDYVYKIYQMMQSYRDRVQAFCRSRTHLGLEDLPKIKYYLRTLMGLEVCLQDETEFLRAKIESLTPAQLPSSTTHPQAIPPLVPDVPSTTHHNTQVHMDERNGHEDKSLQPSDHPYLHKPDWTEPPQSIENHPLNTNYTKRSLEENDTASSKPQKIIKLTVKPPSQPKKPSHPPPTSNNSILTNHKKQLPPQQPQQPQQ
ncbi:hypothetical protein BD560DRAFT_382515 [Blakeslea trispora]|nr:hypothetical protein BD560DRAFT_382515 [Blakeslea trispora]